MAFAVAAVCGRRAGRGRLLSRSCGCPEAHGYLDAASIRAFRPPRPDGVRMKDVGPEGSSCLPCQSLHRFEPGALKPAPTRPFVSIPAPTTLSSGDLAALRPFPAPCAASLPVPGGVFDGIRLRPCGSVSAPCPWTFHILYPDHLSFQSPQLQYGSYPSSAPVLRARLI